MLKDNASPSFTVPIYKRRSLARELKAAVWEMTWGQCWYCGTNYMNPFDNLIIEHVVPLCRGGTNEIENLVPACSSCNESKGVMLVEEWRLHLPYGDDPDEYPWLREYLDDQGKTNGDSCAMLTGRFFYERDPIWENLRASSIMSYRHLQRRKARA
jgi:5-methylcytosine-specific restriction endonuclease McrA